MLAALLSIMTFLVMLVGCASTQETEDKQALTFLQVKEAPGSYQGQSAVFGGKVLTARRQKEGTRIEILQLPLDRSTRPRLAFAGNQPGKWRLRPKR